MIRTAMILGAGYGRRLLPLTRVCPKPLFMVLNRTMLEWWAEALASAGVRRAVVNVHHRAPQMLDHIRDLAASFQGRLEITPSLEEGLLGTGGGLKKAGWFFLGDRGEGRERAFLVHNVDVISNIDFGEMLRFHTAGKALATLAVQDRESSRYLVFDPSLELAGRQAGPSGQPELVRPAAGARPFAFSGIHVISPGLIPRMTETGRFSIIDCYLRLAAQGERILGFRADPYFWRDLGKPAEIARAAADIEAGRLL